MKRNILSIVEIGTTIKHHPVPQDPERLTQTPQGTCTFPFDPIPPVNPTLQCTVEAKTLNYVVQMTATE